MIRCLALGAFAILASGSLAYADVEIATARGPVSLPDIPETVAVLDVAAIDTLAALGVMPVAVPDNLYVTYLDDVATAAEPAGTLFEPDLEELAMLAPDVIIAGGRSATQVDALSGIAPTLDMTISSDLFADAEARIDAYGALFGREAEAAALEAELEEKVAAAKAAAEGRGSALILMVSGTKISAFGSGSRFGWIHDTLGIPEADRAINSANHGDAVSFEFVADVNPDWLIVIDRSVAVGEQGPGAAQTLDNPLVAGTTAWQNDQVVYLDPAAIYIAGGGYTSMSRTLDQMTEAFSR